MEFVVVSPTIVVQSKWMELRHAIRCAYRQAGTSLAGIIICCARIGHMPNCVQCNMYTVVTADWVRPY